MKRKRRKVTAPVPVADQEELEHLVLADTAKFRKLLDAAERRIQRTGGLKHDEFWRFVKDSRTIRGRDTWCA